MNSGGYLIAAMPTDRKNNYGSTCGIQIYNLSTITNSEIYEIIYSLDHEDDYQTMLNALSKRDKLTNEMELLLKLK
jgi:hypothetical protein